VIWDGKTGPFKLKELGDLGKDFVLTDDPVHDAEAIALLFEQAKEEHLISTPTVSGADVLLRVTIDKGFGHYKGYDECKVLMYCSAWECLIGDTLPIGSDFPERCQERAYAGKGSPLAREVLLTILEYAHTSYVRMAPFMTQEDKKLAGID